MDGTSAERGLRSRLERLLGSMCAGLVERDLEARLLLLAALAGEHVLLIGPPGTAKSELSRRLRACFRDARWFERLLTRFSVPEELFGPLSIRGLERDVYERLIEGYLPTSHVAFLDEIFKANSAILNALLTILNEREFDNGSTRLRVPLLCVVGASNEVPAGDELAALADRFLLRAVVDRVSDAGFGALLIDPGAAPAIAEADLLDPPELERLRAAAHRVVLPLAVRALLAELRRRLSDAGIYVSDRRWRKIAGLLRVAAAADERDRVSIADCALVEHCVWTRPEQRAAAREHLAAARDAILRDEPARMEALARTIAAKIAEERRADEQATDAEGRLLFLDEIGRTVTDAIKRRTKTDSSGSPLFRAPAGVRAPSGRTELTWEELWEHHFESVPHGLRKLEAYAAAPANQVFEETVRAPVLVPRRYPREHVRARTRQVEDVLADVRALSSAIAELHASGPTSGLFPGSAIGASVAETLSAGAASLEAATRSLEAAARDAAELREVER